MLAVVMWSMLSWKPLYHCGGELAPSILKDILKIMTLVHCLETLSKSLSPGSELLMAFLKRTWRKLSHGDSILISRFPRPLRSEEDAISSVCEVYCTTWSLLNRIRVRSDVHKASFVMASGGYRTWSAIGKTRMEALTSIVRMLFPIP